jgi:hypothetical protein
MYKYILTLLIILLFTTILPAQNHMDIMTTMTGEHDFAEMGWVMTTLDWNGDGYDDLVINSIQWNPDGYPFTHNTYGKLYVYFGGPNFDNIPEMEIPGHHEIEFSHTTSMCNAGDMNGDGIDDLALFRATMYEDNNDQHYDLQLCVFYGGANPDTIPDYVLTFPREEWDNTISIVQNLGDINHDNHDDVGYIIGKNYPMDSYTFGIVYGGNMTNSTFIEAGSTLGWANICGVGDVNADGIDDFCIGYYSKVILYYGKISSIYSDSLIICQGSNYNTCIFPTGDLNWDGYADFVSSFTGSSAKLYYGGPGFNGTQYVFIAPPYVGGNWRNGFGHGDVNGNGTSDLMGTNVTQANGYGDAYLWMGGVPMNGGADLHIIPPDLPWPAAIDENMFGFCLTMGDYNGDGCCDAAISAPFDYGGGAPAPGYVFVYAGNSQLNDPLPIADDTQVPEHPKLQMFPNPIQPSQSNLNVKFTKQTRNQTSTFEIYNIKGQRVKSYVISEEQAKSGSVNYNLNDLSSGIYVCILTNGKFQQKGKITIVR